MILLYRKLYRLCGLIFPLIYFFTDKGTVLFWLALFAFLALVLEICRFFFPQFNRQLFKSLATILKQKEFQSKVLGTSYFLFGSLLTVLFFERTAAIAALLFLIFGDAASALVGTRWGRIKIGQKSLQGSLACLASCLFIALLLKYSYLGLDLKVGLAGSIVTTLIELAPFPLNDNLSIPLSAALAMTVFS